MYKLYSITCSVNNKKYIGWTGTSLAKRWSAHKRSAKNYTGSSNKLYNAVQKYGIENFEIEVLQEITTEQGVKDTEIKLILEYDTYNTGYNTTLGGDGKAGYKHTEETKNKLSKYISGKNNPFYGSCRTGKHNPNYGKKWTPEMKQRMSEIKKQQFKEKL